MKTPNETPNTQTATHTPGPWRTVPTTARGAGSARLDIVSYGAAYSPSFVAGDILPEDAALICAAPDLLVALENAAAQFEYTVAALAKGQTVSISSLQNCAANARAAISRARGQA